MGAEGRETVGGREFNKAICTMALRQRRLSGSPVARIAAAPLADGVDARTRSGSTGARHAFGKGQVHP